MRRKEFWLRVSSLEAEGDSPNRDNILQREVFSQNEAGQRLTEFCQENTLVIAKTLFQQQKRQLYTWTSPDGQ